MVENPLSTVLGLVLAELQSGSVLLTLANSALDVAAVGALLAAVGYTVRLVAQSVAGWVRWRLERRRVLIEFLIYVEFSAQNAKEVYSEEVLEGVKDKIRTEPGFRPYILKTGDDSALRDLRQFRRTFAPAELTYIHTYTEGTSEKPRSLSGLG